MVFPHLFLLSGSFCSCKIIYLANRFAYVLGNTKNTELYFDMSKHVLNRDVNVKPATSGHKLY